MPDSPNNDEQSSKETHILEAQRVEEARQRIAELERLEEERQRIAEVERLEEEKRQKVAEVERLGEEERQRVAEVKRLEEERRKSIVSQKEEIKRTAIEVSPKELSSKYENDAASANNLYKGKFLKITGKIKNTGKNHLGEEYIILRGNRKIDIMVYFNDTSEESVRLSKGKTITAYGNCYGLFSNVMIKNAFIE